jgi:hypothetical protein
MTEVAVPGSRLLRHQCLASNRYGANIQRPLTVDNGHRPGRSRLMARHWDHSAKISVPRYRSIWLAAYRRPLRLTARPAARHLPSAAGERG